jgi:hypothetical protein
VVTPGLVHLLCTSALAEDRGVSADRGATAQSALSKSLGPNGLAGRCHVSGIVGTTVNLTRRPFHNVGHRARLPRSHAIRDRYSAASHLVAAGVPAFEVADVFGHAELRMLKHHCRRRIESIVTGAVSGEGRAGEPEVWLPRICRPIARQIIGAVNSPFRWAMRPRSHDLHGVNVFDVVRSDPPMVV